MADYDQDKVDEMVLALMQLTLGASTADSAWKGFDWHTLNRLHEKGWIENPVSKAKSVRLTKEGLARSAALFQKHFQHPDT